MNNANNHDHSQTDGETVVGEEVVTETVEGLETNNEATETTDGETVIETHSEELNVSIDDVTKIEEQVRQQEEQNAHLQLATNVANIILNQTDFLNRVTKFVTTSIIQASALYRQNATRPNYVIQRENKDSHVFTIDVISFDNTDPMQSKFGFTALATDEAGGLMDRHDPKHWQNVPEVSPEIFASLVAQLVDLKAIPGDRFYGAVYMAQEQPAPLPIIDELAGVDNLNLPAEPAPQENAAAAVDSAEEATQEPV